MPDPERETVESLEQRLATLEAAVRALRYDLQRARATLTPQRASPTAAQKAPAKQDGPGLLSGEWLPAHLDFEALIGRYGTLVLATVSALAAMGLFLNWAIERGYLGPQQRVGLGLLTAAGLAVAGLRLRRRERSFGASLLGLALAITHVCAWGAGPALHLVPDWGAFLLAALTSMALAVFAHAEADEPLWSVGFSGAAVAPFVTASGRGNLVLLAAYGVAVLVAAGYAMNSRRWIVAGRLFLLAALLYTTALATGFERHYGPLLGMGFPLVVAVLGVVPWSTAWARRERVRALGVMAALASIRAGLGTQHPISSEMVAAAIAAAGLVWLVLVDRTHQVAEPVPPAHRHLHEGDWLDAAVLPLGFALAGLAALDASARGSGAAMAAVAVVLLCTVMRAPYGSLRDAAVFATVAAALVAVMLLLSGRDFAQVAAVAVLGASCFAANRVWRSGSWTTIGLLALGWGMLGSLGQLTARTSYAYPPFGTLATAVAAVVLASTVASAWVAASDERLARWLTGGALAWAFIWVHQEIAFAFNATTAMLLRVTYYAATSVLAVGTGRARRVPLLRHVGLGLALLAAGTALYGARDLDAVAARIGADLVAAIFLLAIAYWYRRPGGQTDEERGAREGLGTRSA